jgi:FlaA1/EpsC-like NDP-sugar epimerase
MELKPRSVRPEDLLGRETVKINENEVKHYVQDRVVLVTGAGGSIGYEISRQVASFAPKELLVFDHHENHVYFLSLEIKNKYPGLAIRTIIGDVRDVGLLKHLFSSRRPQVVFHAAAHKHVPLMEDCPVAAVKNNIFGTRNLIYASNHYGVERFVLISTDKAVNPLNTMGMSKRVAEMILQAKASRSKTKFMAVRFGNVLGSAGSVVPLFKRQIENGGPVTVTHPEVKRYFMSIKEAVMLVLQAGAIGKGGELFILDMGDQIKVNEIAKNLIALSGLTLGKDIEIKYTGLRPGEKMEEELLLDKEKDVVTNHNKIFVSHCGETFNRAVLQRDLRKLHRMAQEMDEVGILSLLKEIIVDGNS